MPLSLSAYRRGNADPKRSEAARRGAWTRQLREEMLDVAIKRFAKDHGRYPDPRETANIRNRVREIVPPYRV